MEKKCSYIIVLVWCCLMGTTCLAQGWDAQALQKINAERNKKLDNFFCGLSNSDTYTAIGTPIATYAIGVMRNNKVLQQQALVNVVGLGLNSVATVGLKYAVNRPRPALTHSFIMPLQAFTKHSFPSGHTSLAFCTATHLSLACKKWYCVVPAYSYAALMGYSRMHMGVHYPSDVLAGAVIGIGSALLAKQINKKLLGKKKYSNTIHKFIF